MKILIVSDNHRQTNNFLKVYNQVSPVDLVIHCGDAEGSNVMIEQIIDCPLYIVSGNNDYFSDLPQEREFLIGRYKIWLIHGHRQFVTIEEKTIRREAVNRGFDIVMYGHTHRPVVDIRADIIAVNPGSLNYPRQEGRRPSYIIMEIDKEQEAHFTVNYLHK